MAMADYVKQQREECLQKDKKSTSSDPRHTAADDTG